MTGAAIMLAIFLWREIYENPDNEGFGVFVSALCVAAVFLMGLGVGRVIQWFGSWL